MEFFAFHIILIDVLQEQIRVKEEEEEYGYYQKYEKHREHKPDRVQSKTGKRDEDGWNISALHYF